MLIRFNNYWKLLFIDKYDFYKPELPVWKSRGLLFIFNSLNLILNNNARCCRFRVELSNPASSIIFRLITVGHLHT
jgi:hypothetical protein